ncbi:MAG: hypothetical protein AB8F26_03170 [Phycisphaerales bacterium]
MARKAKTKKKTKKAISANADRNRRIAIGVAVSAAGIAAFVGATIGLSHINERAADHLASTSALVNTSGAPASGPAVNIVWPRNPDGQTWMPQAERERLAGLMVNAVRGGQALTGEPLAEIGAALLATGWFNGDPSVRWTYDGQIEVEGTWRTPAAAVRNGPREHLIDYHARVLPLDYPVGQSNQIFLLNPSQPKPRNDSSWAGEDLRASLDLILLLQKEQLLEQVAGIDLGSGRDAGRLAIITDRGSRVIWGGGPDHLRPAEQPTSVKLNRLRTLLERTGRIDGSVDRIDLRGPQILLERTSG